jgi:PTH1 family peptidyl-tRNA hydrolase
MMMAGAPQSRRCVKVIAGLGNPGREYEQTPHNVGFDVVQALCGRFAAEWHTSRRFQARIAKTAHAGETVLLVQPLTYMNLSGSSVAPILRYHGGTADDLIIVADDADLPLGRLRVKPSGGSGGHRGLASVIEAIGTEAFTRVRLGVGRDSSGGLVSHVLGRLDGASLEQARKTIETAAEAVCCLLTEGVAEAMNRYNGWRAEEAQPAESVKGLRA